MANFGQQGDANLSCVASTRTQRASEEWKPKPIAGVVEFGRSAARLCDLFDKSYAANVVTNATRGRYFEPGAGRRVYVAMRVGR